MTTVTCLTGSEVSRSTHHLQIWRKSQVFRTFHNVPSPNLIAGGGLLVMIVQWLQQGLQFGKILIDGTLCNVMTGMICIQLDLGIWSAQIVFTDRRATSFHAVKFNPASCAKAMGSVARATASTIV